MNPQRQESPGAQRSYRRGFWVTSGIYGLAMMGGTVPIPLYRFWGPEMHFGSITTTLIFAVYAVGVVVSLILLPSLSDQLGRRPVLAGALIVLAASTVEFLLASSVTDLLIARFVFGIGAGVVTATANAALAELAGEKHGPLAAQMSTVANMGGLGLGGLAAGLLAGWAADPTHLVFYLYLGAIVIALLALLAVPETVTRGRSFRLEVRRPAVPGVEDRGDFLRLLALVFAAFAVNGLFSSLVPKFLSSHLGLTDVALGSAVVSVIFFAALAAQLSPGPKWLTGPTAGPALLVIGVAAFETGLLVNLLPLFLAGTVVAGAGIGLIFGRGIAKTQQLADPSRRADLVATYFLAAYLGTTVPTVGLGVLDQILGVHTSTIILAALVVVVVAVTMLTNRRPNGPHQKEDALA